MSRKLSMKIYYENTQDTVALTYKLKMLVRQAIEAALDYEQYGNPCEVWCFLLYKKYLLNNFSGSKITYFFESSASAELTPHIAA